MGRGKRQQEMTTMRRKRKGVRILIVVLAVWAIAHAAYTTIDGLRDYRGDAAIAVVLGNRVYAGGRLSPVLKGRVDRALRLYREGRVPRIMVSGGRGLRYDKYPEGLAMKQYLVAHGVPADRIIEDDDGENTYLTAKDFLRVADSLQLRSAIVVSSFYHITRAKYIIRKLGFQNVHSVSSDVFFWNDCVGLPRDCVGFYIYLLKY
jgi:vancomycin permeability regulator SanA